MPPRRPERDTRLALLAELTAMLTLALDDDRKELDRYIAALPAADLRDLLTGAVELYGHAFTRAGDAQGFDPVAVNRAVALREAAERWTTPAAD